MRNPNITYKPRRSCWEVVADFDIDIDGYSITVPTGFATDLASIPWLLRGLINTYELGITGPIVHDYCYVNQGLISAAGRSINREQADRFFAALMFGDGVAIWRIACAYYAVRVFGRIWWQD